jgi:hypothetical protein
MQPAKHGVKSLADHHAIANDHGADEWVRADAPATALGELECPAQISGFLFGVDRGDARPPFGSSSTD